MRFDDIDDDHEAGAATTPSLGTVLRKARERRGLSTRQLASLAGLSAAFVGRIERDVVNPTWRTIALLAQTLGTEPLLRLIPNESTMTATTALVEKLSPVQRLWRQPVDTFTALTAIVRSGLSFVVTGSVAALVQGFPAPVEDLHVVVADDDTNMGRLGDLLLREQLLFAEMGVEELRRRAQRSWAIGDCDVAITLASELPPSTIVRLDDIEVRVLLPHALLDDPEVGATLRISSVRSSEL